MSGFIDLVHGPSACYNLHKIVTCGHERRIGLSLNGGFPEDAVTYVRSLSFQQPVEQISESPRPYRSVAGHRSLLANDRLGALPVLISHLSWLARSHPSWRGPSGRHRAETSVEIPERIKQ